MTRFWPLLAVVLLWSGTGCNETLIDDAEFVCQTDSDCAEGWTCDRRRNICVDPNGTRGCETPFSFEECAAGQRCVGGSAGNNVCVDSECRSNDQCSGSEKCLVWRWDYGECFSSGTDNYDDRDTCQRRLSRLSDSCQPDQWCAEVMIQDQSFSRCRPACDTNDDSDDCGCRSVEEGSVSGYCTLNLPN